MEHGDCNYGFIAIENRYEVLGGTPRKIEENQKIDLSRLLIDLYGSKYIGHPRLEQLIKLNDIGNKDFLKGQEEAKCFDDKEFIKLHQSTWRKVDIFNIIIDRLADNTLKTNARKTETYGLTPQGIYEIISERWWGWILTIIILCIVGFYILN